MCPCGGAWMDYHLSEGELVMSRFNTQIEEVHRHLKTITPLVFNPPFPVIEVEVNSDYDYASVQLGNYAVLISEEYERDIRGFPVPVPYYSVRWVDGDGEVEFASHRTARRAVIELAKHAFELLASQTIDKAEDLRAHALNYKEQQTELNF